MKKILVTGGAGYKGLNFIKYLNKEHSECYVVNVDKVNNDYNCENYKFIQGDISDRNFIFNLFEKEKFDIVVNFATTQSDEYDMKDKSIFTITNIMGTQVLLDGSREYGIKRYHQISTSEVDKDLDKLDCPNYISSKLAADKLVLGYKKMYGLKATISRIDEVKNIQEYCKSIYSIINDGIPGTIYNL